MLGYAYRCSSSYSGEISTNSQIFTGNITIYDSVSIGGFIGYAVESDITNCTQKFTGDVKALDQSGGVNFNNYSGNTGGPTAGCIGTSNSSTITNIHSIFRGDITGRNACGGMLGLSQFSNISQCFFDYGGGVFTCKEYCGLFIGNYKANTAGGNTMSNVTIICREHPSGSGTSSLSI